MLMMCPPPWRIMAGSTARQAEERRPGVHVHDEVEPLRPACRGCRPSAGARVVDEQVDPPEALQRLGRHGLDLLGVAHVHLHRQRLRTQGFHLGGDGEDRAGQFLCRLGALRGDDDVAPGLRQAQRDGPADAPARPGHDGDFPLKRWHEHSPDRWFAEISYRTGAPAVDTNVCMNPIDTLFRDLRAAKRAAFMPFVTAGDPDLAFTRDLLPLAAEAGADLFEIGFPFSDPIADGPVVQASYTRALDKHLKLADAFSTLKEVTSRPGWKTPLVAMASYSLMFRKGTAAFIDTAKSAGLSGVIVPDLPVEEAGDLSKLAADRDFKLVLLVTPTTSPERAEKVVRVRRVCLRGERGWHHRRTRPAASGASRTARAAPLDDRSAALRWLRREQAGARSRIERDRRWRDRRQRLVKHLEAPPRRTEPRRWRACGNW